MGNSGDKETFYFGIAILGILVVMTFMFFSPMNIIPYFSQAGCNSELVVSKGHFEGESIVLTIVERDFCESSEAYSIYYVNGNNVKKDSRTFSIEKFGSDTGILKIEPSERDWSEIVIETFDDGKRKQDSIKKTELN